MGINISWGKPAGSEEELRGHNVDPHRSPVLQGSDALVSPQTGDPRLFPYHCDPQGQLRQHKHECAGIMLTPWGPQNLHPRGSALGGNAAAPTPKKTMLRGDAASTAARTRQAMGSVANKGAPFGKRHIVSRDGDGNPAPLQTSSTGRGGGRGKPALSKPQTPSQTKACNSGQRMGMG